MKYAFKNHISLSKIKRNEVQTDEKKKRYHQKSSCNSGGYSVTVSLATIEVKNDNHEARTGTHYYNNTGFMVKPYSEITYLNKSNQLVTVSEKDGELVSSKDRGWVMSNWLSLPKGQYSSVSSIRFCTILCDAYDNEGCIDVVTVN